MRGVVGIGGATYRSTGGLILALRQKGSYPYCVPGADGRVPRPRHGVGAISHRDVSARILFS
ncbi:MAG: hypothetical protein WA688_05245 [Thermoplasmata archaeon]